MNTVAIPEEKFRPKDLPLGWECSPSRDKREWLTKATEQAYYDYCNNRKYRIDYYAKHLDDSDEDLLKKADKALYQAKNTGRNKVVVQDV